jgi:hypothetical protein
MVDARGPASTACTRHFNSSMTCVRVIAAKLTNRYDAADY